MTSGLFEEWFSKHLLPVTPEGAVIIMDNASFHRKKQLNELAAENGRQVIFLPPYSPELNPIEHFWNWLKEKVSDYIVTCKNLDNAISVAFKVWGLYHQSILSGCIIFLNHVRMRIGEWRVIFSIVDGV